MKLNFKKATGLALALGLGLSSITTFASSTTKTLTAIVDNYRVTLNGQEKQAERDIYMIDSSIYVSLRDLAQMTGLQVNWDGANKTVELIDNGNSDDAARIVFLEAQNKVLQERIDELEGNSSSTGDANLDRDSISDTLSDIKSEFYRDLSMRWSFDLSERRGNLELLIEFDGARYGDVFADLRDRDVEYFIEDICELIRENHAGVEIIGTLEDSDSGEVLIDFTYDEDGYLDYERNMSLSQLESEVYSEFRTFPSINYEDLAGRTLRISDVEIQSTTRTISVAVGLDFSQKDDWDELVRKVDNDSNSNLYYTSNLRDLEDHLYDIADFVEYELDTTKNVDVYLHNMNGLSSSKSASDGDLIARFMDGRMILNEH